jgi:hypothetical protein
VTRNQKAHGIELNCQVTWRTLRTIGRSLRGAKNGKSNPRYWGPDGSSEPFLLIA